MTVTVNRRGAKPEPSASKRLVAAVTGVTEDTIAWTEIGPGLWVARRGNDFAGMVEKLWGAGFRVTDCSGAILGEFATFASAKARIS